MKRLTFLLAVFASMLMISGCGQSGPLYVPGNPSTMAVPPSEDSASEEAEEEEESSPEASDPQ
jgi:predicted small lipoprotein YifL